MWPAILSSAYIILLHFQIYLLNWVFFKKCQKPYKTIPFSFHFFSFLFQVNFTIIMYPSIPATIISFLFQEGERSNSVLLSPFSQSFEGQKGPIAEGLSVWTHQACDPSKISQVFDVVYNWLMNNFVFWTFPMPPYLIWVSHI